MTEKLQLQILASVSRERVQRRLETMIADGRLSLSTVLRQYGRLMDACGPTFRPYGEWPAEAKARLMRDLYDLRALRETHGKGGRAELKAVS